MESTRRSTARRRRYGALGCGALLVGALAYVGLVDPHNPNSVFPVCPFRLLTGWNCPACGGLRMTHDLLHGDLAAAVADNVFLLVGMPLLAAWILLRRYRHNTAPPTPTIVAVVIVTFAWTVLRNLPGFPLVPTVLSG
ncbi:MAG: DUF2752 domain-containing protein [Mycobacterium sp.]|nr:DUF2752 domain-containing protein [Mycobacterium sp.]